MHFSFICQNEFLACLFLWVDIPIWSRFTLEEIWFWLLCSVVTGAYQDRVAEPGARILVCIQFWFSYSYLGRSLTSLCQDLHWEDESNGHPIQTKDSSKLRVGIHRHLLFVFLLTFSLIIYILFQVFIQMMLLDSISPSPALHFCIISHQFYGQLFWEDFQYHNFLPHCF